MKTMFLRMTVGAILLSTMVLNAGDPRSFVNSYQYDPDTGTAEMISTVVGIGNKGVITATVNDNKDGFNKASLVLKDFGKEQGWDSAKHLRFIPYNPKIVGFGNKGVSEVNIGSISGSTTQLLINDFGYDQGWRNDKHLRFVTNIGTGGTSIVGFGNKGVSVGMREYDFSDGSFSDMKVSLVLNDFGYDQGWRNDKHLRLTTNIGSSLAIVGFGNQGVFVSPSLNQPYGELPEYEKPKLWLNDFGYDQGWRNDKHLRFMTNIGSGPSSTAIIAFGNKGVSISKLNDTQDGFETQKVVLNDFGYVQGWRNDKHLRFFVDITGDYIKDIVGFGNNGVMVSEGNSDGTYEEPKVWLGNFGYNQGWRNDKHVRMLQDVNADGLQDIIGFGNQGIFVSLNLNGSGFDDPTLWLNDFGYNQGWRVEPQQQKQQ